MFIAELAGVVLLLSMFVAGIVRINDERVATIQEDLYEERLQHFQLLNDPVVVVNPYRESGQPDVPTYYYEIQRIGDLLTFVNGLLVDIGLALEATDVELLRKNLCSVGSITTNNSIQLNFSLKKK